MIRVLCVLLIVAAAIVSMVPTADAGHCDQEYYWAYYQAGYYGGYWYSAGYYKVYYPKKVDKQTYSVSVNSEAERLERIVSKLIDLQTKQLGVDVAAVQAPTTAIQVFNARCQLCHATEAAAKAKGSDFVLSPGDLSKLERGNIKRRIETTDAAKRMPPGMQLPATEKQLLLDVLAN